MKRVIIDSAIVRVSKPGRSAESSNLDDFLLHENFEIDLAVGGVHRVSIIPATIAHNLGYRPIVFVGGTSLKQSAPDPCPVYAWADAVNVYVYSSRGVDAQGNPIFLSPYQPTEPVAIIILAEPQP